MALNQSRRWLVAYDISDPKRLARVYRFMVKKGVPLQFSLFSVTMTTRQAQALGAQLCNLIDRKEDDLRLYPLPDGAVIERLGKHGLLDENLFNEGTGG